MAIGDRVQIASAQALATLSVTATFPTAVTAGNAVVVVVADFDAVFGTFAPTLTSSPPGATFSHIVTVQWAGGGGGVRDGIYAYVVLAAGAVTAVTATFANTGNGTAVRALYIAEYVDDPITPTLAIDGSTSAAAILTGSAVLSMTTVSGPVTKTARYQNADSRGFGAVLFALSTGASTDVFMACTAAFETLGTGTTSSVSGMGVAAHEGPLTFWESFYFDGATANHVFGGPSRQGPPG